MTLKEEIENIKFNCPTCPLPHNLSGKEIDKLLSLLNSRAIKEARREERKEIMKEILPGLTIIKSNIDASQDFVSNPVSKRIMKDILDWLKALNQQGEK